MSVAVQAGPGARGLDVEPSMGTRGVDLRSGWRTQALADYSLVKGESRRHTEYQDSEARRLVCFGGRGKTGRAAG